MFQLNIHITISTYRGLRPPKIQNVLILIIIIIIHNGKGNYKLLKTITYIIIYIYSKFSINLTQVFQNNEKELIE